MKFRKCQKSEISPAAARLCWFVVLTLLSVSGAVADPRPPVDSTAVSATQLSDLQWIAGSWHGKTGENGHVEEVWTSPAAGAMAGMFRWHDGETVRLYEFMLIRATASGIELRIKHFSDDLKGWESREDSMQFQLFGRQEQRAVFRMETPEELSYLTYERQGDVLTVTLDKKVDDRESQTKFTFEAR